MHGQYNDSHYGRCPVSGRERFETVPYSSGNSEKRWVPEPDPYLTRGQAWNDKPVKIYVAT
jgi:hypothetical protein